MGARVTGAWARVHRGRGAYVDVRVWLGARAGVGVERPYGCVGARERGRMGVLLRGFFFIIVLFVFSLHQHE